MLEITTLARRLADDIAELSFARAAAFVYNPLAYAWRAHAQYLERFGAGRKRTLFIGMNPGPFGMVQTGVPFGEVSVVRDWLRIDAPIERPAREHPKRPVLGYECTRAEVSGQRLWGLFRSRFATPEAFFAEHFVVNYCPLAFVEASGKNLTPDKLPPAKTARLYQLCDDHLARVIEVLAPEFVVGVGAFALDRVERVAPAAATRVQILHPSPASPAANRGWANAATKQLIDAGVWS
jgi:single-strand selective monofunctional uracil DNA glycosylase